MRIRGHRLKSGLISALWVGFLGWPMASSAQQISARAYLSSNEVGVGQQFVLNVEVTGVQRLDADPSLPDLSAFARYLGSGSSTAMQMVNGRTSLTLTMQYRYQATAQGRHRVGAISVSAGGNRFRTEPLSLRVLDAPTHGASGTGAPDDFVAPEDLFVEADVSKRRVFENEPIVIEYRIFTRVNVESYSITDLPAATGFWTEELEQSESPQVDQVIRDGQQYASAMVRRVAVFPTGVGDRVLDPLTLEAQVRTRRRSPDPFGGIFDRAGLLGSLVPVAVSTRPVAIEVLALPSEGRSASFSGHVGTLTVSSSVDRTQLQPNEAVTFRVEFSGAGNLRSIPAPKIDFPPELEVFPPEASVEVSEGGGSIRGTRAFEYVVIPRVPGQVDLPAIEVSAFDARARMYRTSTADGITLDVLGPSAGGSVGRMVPSSVDPIREEIRFIHLATPKFRRMGRSLFHTPGFWIVFLLPVVAALGCLLLRGHWDRLEGDVAYARFRRAGRAGRKRLRAARRLASGNARDFYGEVAGALTGYLADKLNLSEAGLVREHLRGLEGEMGLSGETLGRVDALLDECDRQRFALTSEVADEPRVVLDRVQELMRDLDRELD